MLTCRNFCINKQSFCRIQFFTFWKKYQWSKLNHWKLIHVLLFRQKFPTSWLQSFLTHSFPIHPFSSTWKHQKTLRFFDVFRGWGKGALGPNGLKVASFRIFYFCRVCLPVKILFRFSMKSRCMQNIVTSNLREYAKLVLRGVWKDRQWKKYTPPWWVKQPKNSICYDFWNWDY